MSGIPSYGCLFGALMTNARAWVYHSARAQCDQVFANLLRKCTWHPLELQCCHKKAVKQLVLLASYVHRVSSFVGKGCDERKGWEG